MNEGFSSHESLESVQSAEELRKMLEKVKPQSRYNNLIRSLKFGKTMLLVMLETMNAYDDKDKDHLFTKKLSEDIDCFRKKHGIEEEDVDNYEDFIGNYPDNMDTIKPDRCVEIIEILKKVELVYQDLLNCEFEGKNFTPKDIRQ